MAKRKEVSKKKVVVHCFYMSPGIKYILFTDKTYKVIRTYDQSSYPK